MKFLRSPQLSAVLLLTAAVLGIALANSPASSGFLSLLGAHIGPAAIGLDLSVAHWIMDGLLAVFFFVVAAELRHEVRFGSLNNPRTAAVPIIASVGGVVAPTIVYLALTWGSGYEYGWPVPTATDIAFALGVLAMFGRWIPAKVRLFLLTAAVIDDIIAILLIAILFTTDAEPLFALLACVPIVLFSWLSYAKTLNPWLKHSGLVLLALLAWVCVYHSGIHATIAGVLLGLTMSDDVAHKVRHALEPFVNGGVLPLFALVAAAVIIPSGGFAGLSPAFWGIIVALPVGKIVGIAGVGWIAQRLLTPAPERLPVADLVTIGVVGAIGFTMSLLLGELAFEGHDDVGDQGVLAVLAASLVAVAFAAVIVTLRNQHYRRLADASIESSRDSSDGGTGD